MTTSTAAMPLAPLPRPMLPNVAGAAKRRLECHDAESLRALAEPAACNWAYTVERSPSGVAKPGWIATAPLVACTFTYDFRAAANATGLHRIGVGYLKSYEHMGKVHVSCVHDCECDQVIDAHNSEKISPLDLMYFTAHVKPPANTQLVAGTSIGATDASALSASAPRPARCGIRLTVLKESSSGEHKFKLTALFLNRHGDSAFFGRWIFNQANEARGAVSVAEQAEELSKKRSARVSRGGRRSRRKALGSP